MRLRRPHRAAALLLALALSGCTHDDVKTDAKPSGPPAPAMDYSQLSLRFAGCSDLNGFVNSKWLEQATIPDDRPRYSSFDELTDASHKVQHEILDDTVQGIGSADASSIEYQLGVLYRDATDDAKRDAAGYEPIRPTLTAIDATKTPADIARFLGTDAAGGDDLVFGFTAGADYAKATDQIGYASSDALGMPSKDYYTDPKYAPVFDAYRKYIVSTFTLIGTRPDIAQTRMQQVVSLESALAAGSLNPVEQRDPANQYKLVTPEQANAVTPHFDWRAYLHAVGAPDNRPFSLAETAFFQAFDHALDTVDMDTWKSYLTFHAVARSAASLSKAFRDNAFVYSSVLSGTTKQRPRWEQELAAVNSLLGPALGQLYVKKTFSSDDKNAAATLVNNVKEALRQRILAVDWMTDRTKVAARAKWDKIIVKVGYPDHNRDYGGLKLPGDSFFTDRAAVVKFNHDYEMGKIGHPTDRSLWDMTPQTVNAQYNPSENSITIPAAILRSPFYDAKGDSAFNYGGIGTVIGHELTHAFDDQGSQFDGDGNRVNWWTPDDRAEFDKRTNRLVDQFNSYAPIPGQPDLHVNGKLTLGENIADLGGVNTAYDALVTTLGRGEKEDADIAGFTARQRFFLSYARIWRNKQRPEAAVTQLAGDPHSPAALRINGVVPNVPAFAAAFGCRQGDAMVNGTDRFVKIW